MSSVNDDSFISFFLIHVFRLSFSCLIAKSRTSGRMPRRNRERDVLDWFLTRVGASQCITAEHVSCGFSDLLGFSFYLFGFTASSRQLRPFPARRLSVPPSRTTL